MGTALSGYAECYPGLEEMADAIDDSDDEADYSKMDMVSGRRRRSDPESRRRRRLLWRQG